MIKFDVERAKGGYTENVEFQTLEEFLAWIKEQNEAVIVRYCDDGVHELMIYDDYIE